MRALVFVTLLTNLLFAQAWVDTVYSIQLQTNIPYDTAPDFAGVFRTLELDIAIPVNDTPPPQGRPLLLEVHGGGFIGGDKAAGYPRRLIEDFAKRGYVAASINYRLGYFPWRSDWNCNVSSFGLPWNCLNTQDTMEWYRAWYRAVVDAHAAVEFLVARTQYQIDPDRVYLTGESAGGFIAMGLAYLDVPGEALAAVDSLPNALPPHPRYESCDPIPIASMDLKRPALSRIAARTYRVRGVGNIFGGMVQNLFLRNASPNLPRLYLFHQPNDPIVPYDFARAYQRYNACASGVFGCGGILNRIHVAGSKGIYRYIKAQIDSGHVNMVVQFDTTTNRNQDCLHLTLANTEGHNLDNYWRRTRDMAIFFAETLPTSLVPSLRLEMDVFPNPVRHTLNISAGSPLRRVSIMDLRGKVVLERYSREAHIRMETRGIPPGCYLVQAEDLRGVRASRKVVLEP